ncbi:PTS mannitol-specific transporter subunit IIBC [Tetragenococcus halophilus]|uniref:PTS system mannitol-specific EIICB component n=1 Tax=Tetragenococcus halophilus TaxID=51669 RepID=A0AB35HPH5_TETHA|nr:PTS mannitol-specific transporter subunit IIBC [Tetragenococcus halophilus]AOF48201.1 PTS mannitol transferase subunit IIB [Tetragenococcus halophilus]MCF1600713.1 PTS mannitol-specific transporter subunit IIBC [Tetragenococcus halophilus]MCF1675296.1 PTS mannitol-specific transporter subunit IIBC [Tetragenococcus halophilus]MCF1685754.1 PTS mannitol-specific transporter subunit IIBC [Tetragenococcus halophilus]MCO8284579.1 PTS mannitol transporter subunit IICBA [Tetragenococcus halophilus]
MAQENKGIKAKVQQLGSSLSSMVMPNIGAFIAWGVITALFIPDGFLPNEQLASMTDPMITYLLPLLIGYTGGSMIHEQRGAVVGAIATMGVIVGSDVPMFIGAMMMGPLGGWCIKKFDERFGHRIRAGFEMLVNNFSSGLIGFALAIIGYYAVGPIVSILTEWLGLGVAAIIQAGLLPLANIFIEPAKILFLNNAINHGILTPLGTEQSIEAGKSILFLLEANPGPGLGVLLAFTLFGKGSAKASAPGAILIQFVGGIHEIYFPYVMMKPLMFLAVIAGGMSGTFTFQLLDAGLRAAASPGSIIAVLGMTPPNSYVAVIAGVVVATIVSFLVGMVILKSDRSEANDEDLAAQQAAVQSAKQESKGQAAENTATTDVENAELRKVDQVIFACDAGMGSSAMGASVLRKKMQEAGIDMPVSNASISKLKDDANTLVITQNELHDRAVQKAPSAEFVSVENFMNSPRYDEIVERMKNETSQVENAEETTAKKSNKVEDLTLSEVKHIVFACEAGMGSSAMGASVLRNMVKKSNLDVDVTNLVIDHLEDDAQSLVVTQKELYDRAEQKAPSAQFITVDNFMDTESYEQIVERMKEQ